MAGRDSRRQKGRTKIEAEGQSTLELAIANLKGSCRVFMVVTPFIQSIINGIFIGINQCSMLYSGLYQGLNGGLLDIREHLNYHLATPLYHSENRRRFFLQRTRMSTIIIIRYATQPLLFCTYVLNSRSSQNAT